MLVVKRMKITEITNKYFFAHSGGALVLEAYRNPEEELLVKFTLTDQESDKKFYGGIVYDKSTGKKNSFHHNLSMFFLIL